MSIYHRHRSEFAPMSMLFIDYHTCNGLSLAYIYMCYIFICVFYRLIRNVMHLKKHSNIKTKPNQTKPAKITKTKNINVCTNNHTLLKIH